jgi:Family of unknown function (DUF6502)
VWAFGQGWFAVNSRPGEHLLVALRRVLRPIIGILIRAGIRFDEFSDLARGVYVESAIRDGLDQTTRPTRARVSMITGLTRQQIDYYLVTDGALPHTRPTLASVLVEVLQKWHTDAQYVGPYGIPLELEFEATTGRSFRSLVALVDSQVSAGIVLEELLRVGSVAYSGEKHFRAVSRYFMMPVPMSPQQLEYFGNTLTRLAKTLEYNMDPQNPQKRLERFVVADRGLPRELLSQFERYARERTSEFLLDLDNWLTPHSASDGADFSGRVGTGLNVFLYVDSPEDEKPLASLVAPRDESSESLKKSL